MELIVLYLGVTMVGYFVGSKCREKKGGFPWIGKVQVVFMFALVFIMGSRIGADETVIESLGSIGLIAFVLTAFVIAGSVVAVFFVRRLLKYDRKGMTIND